MVKPNGRIVIAVPNYKSYDACFYKDQWAAYDVPRHLNHFNKETIVKIFKTNNLTHIKTEKLVWDAYYISFLSERYQQHGLPLLRGACHGLQSNMKALHTGMYSSLVYRFKNSL